MYYKSVADSDHPTYQDVVVNGFDSFNYSAPEMYDLIMANSWYPAYWEVPQNFMWINNESYYRRYIKMQNWKTYGLTVENHNFSTLSTSFSTAFKRKIPCKHGSLQGIFVEEGICRWKNINQRSVYRTPIKTVFAQRTHGCDWRKFLPRYAGRPPPKSPRGAFPIGAANSPPHEPRTDSSA